MNNYPNSRKNELVVKEVADETLIYDLRVNKAFCLNETSALVWERCDGKTSIPKISKAVGEKLGQSIDDAIIWLAIEEFRKDGLLSKGYVFESHFDGLTRRQVLRNIGVLSVISLPIVTSLVAPRASFAQSCVGVGTIPSGTLLTGSDCPFPGSPCSCSGFNSSCCSGSASVDSCTTDPGVAPGLPAGMQRCFCMCD